MNHRKLAAHQPDPVFVVLGATGGIGSVLSRQLAAGGARLLLGARNEDRLRRLADEIGAEARPLNATEFDQVDACLDEARRTFGRIDGVANLVGSLLLKPAHQTTSDEFETTVALNLGSAFAAVRAGARHLREGGGSIVLVSSAAARAGLANHEAIAAAKAGVSGLARAAAATYGRYGIRVNAVAPGLVRTGLTEALTSSEVARKVSESMHALGRLGEPADIADAIAWLLDGRAGWVTGQVLGIDGGLATVRPRTKV